MKPKTEIQKEVKELSETLKKPSKRLCKSMEQIATNWATIKYGKTICLECKHRWEKDENWKEDQIIKCPKCKKKLRFITEKNQNYWLSREIKNGHVLQCSHNYTKIETIKDWLVIRNYLIIKDSFTTKENKTQILEVEQLFVREKNKVKISMLKTPMSFIGYSRYSELEIKYNKELNEKTTEKIKLEYISEEYQKKGITQETMKLIEKRILDSLEVIPNIIQDNRAETLLKLKKYDLLNTECYKDYWQQIKIALRHKYNWKDKWELCDWIDMIQMMKQLKKDINNPKIILPENIKEEHNKYYKKLTEKRKQERIKQIIEENKRRIKENKEWAKKRKQYLKINIESKNFKFKILNEYEEYVKEGEKMHNCVAVGGYYTKPNTIIIMCFENTGERLAMIEYNTEKNIAIQVRGINNSIPEKYDSIVKTLEKNKANFKLKKKNKTSKKTLRKTTKSKEKTTA